MLVFMKIQVFILILLEITFCLPNIKKGAFIILKNAQKNLVLLVLMDSTNSLQITSLSEHNNLVKNVPNIWAIGTFHEHQLSKIIS